MKKVLVITIEENEAAGTETVNAKIYGGMGRLEVIGVMHASLEALLRPTKSERT